MFKKEQTRWTFYKVKLVFECDFEIYWSLGPWNPWTLGSLDLGTGLWDLFPPPPPGLVWSDMVWDAGEGGVSDD